MTDCIQPLLADAIINGMALLAAAFVGYLCWLRFREKRQQRRLEQERERNRKKNWGYE